MDPDPPQTSNPRREQDRAALALRRMSRAWLPRVMTMCRAGAVGSLLCVLGCVSSMESDAYRVARYQPTLGAGRPSGLPLESGGMTPGLKATDATPDVARPDVARQPEVAPLPGRMPAPAVGEAVPAVGEAVPAVGEAVPAVGEAVPAVTPSKRVGSRVLTRGQRLQINLLGIPSPIEINDEIDDRGRVNLVYVGPVELEGLTTSQAEELIEQTYINAKVFREVTAIVIAQLDDYFVDGEVKQPGKYQMAADLTLLMAISSAGGYTEWAKPSRIKILRGEQVLWFNGKRIAQGKEEDPRILDDDIIHVERRWFFD